MGCADVAISAFIGVLIFFAWAIWPSELAAPIRYVVEAGVAFWYVGVGMVAASLLLRWRKRLPRVARVLGVAGVIWVTVVLGVVGLLLVFIIIRGPIGP